MIEITKTCAVTSIKARNYLVPRCTEKRVLLGKKTENGKIIFFKALANRF